MATSRGDTRAEEEDHRPYISSIAAIFLRLRLPRSGKIEPMTMDIPAFLYLGKSAWRPRMFSENGLEPPVK